MTTSEYRSLYEQDLQAVFQKGYLDEDDNAAYSSLSEPYVVEALDSIKDKFPRDKERMILTNGIGVIALSADNVEKSTTVGWKFAQEHPKFTRADFAEYFFNAVVELKKQNPEAPVYNVHNHPSQDTRTVEAADALADKGVPYEDQGLVGKIPSRADIKMWTDQANLVQGAIYIQDIDSVVSYTNDWSESTNYGTQIALDYVPAQKANPLWGGEGIPEKWVPRIAPEGESVPGTVYIPFDKWDEEKDKYNIDWFAVSDWIKKR